MTRPPNARGQGRKAEPGTMVQVQIRVISDEELATIADLSPRERAQSMLVAQGITRTGDRQIVRLASPLPCALRAADGVCGNAAYLAHADAVELSGQFATPGQWLLQPVCETCAKAMAAMYK